MEKMEASDHCHCYLQHSNLLKSLCFHSSNYYQMFSAYYLLKCLVTFWKVVFITTFCHWGNKVVKLITFRRIQNSSKQWSQVLEHTVNGTCFYLFKKCHSFFFGYPLFSELSGNLTVEKEILQINSLSSPRKCSNTEEEKCWSSIC